mmetsp:Transcript_16161/g.14095  ORF Transcript_16161/g.14095 Transcript_16161/m.14095 type:complete len:151 (-) Transcript_16161:51-503(-)
MAEKKPEIKTHKLDARHRLKKSRTRPSQIPPLIDHFKFNNPPGLIKSRKGGGMCLYNQVKKMGKRNISKIRNLKKGSKKSSSPFKKGSKKRNPSFRLTKTRTGPSCYKRTSSRYKILYEKRSKSRVSVEDRQFQLKHARASQAINITQII